MVKQAEDEENDQDQQKIDCGLYAFCKEKQIFRYIDFCKYSWIVNDRCHSFICWFAEVVENQHTGEKISGVIGCIAPKKMSEDQTHDQQLQQRI